MQKTKNLNYTFCRSTNFKRSKMCGLTVVVLVVQGEAKGGGEVQCVKL